MAFSINGTDNFRIKIHLLVYYNLYFTKKYTSNSCWDSMKYATSTSRRKYTEFSKENLFCLNCQKVNYDIISSIIVQKVLDLCQSSNSETSQSE